MIAHSFLTARRLAAAGAASLLLLSGTVILSAGSASATVSTVDGITSNTPELIMGGSEASVPTLTSRFTLTVPQTTTLAEIRLSLRSTSVPGDSFDTGRLYNVALSGSKTFTFAPKVPDGTWTAAPLWNKGGRWNMGPRVTFTQKDGWIRIGTATLTSPTATPTPTATPVTSTPAPTPTATTVPVAPPPASTTPVPHPTSTFSAQRAGNFESGFGDWDLGGASVYPNPGASVSRDTSRAYEGAAAARASLPSGGGNKFARTLWGNSTGQSGALNYGEGKDFTYGMALYLPTGFYANMQSYFVPMRWDNYGVGNVSRSGLAMYADGSMRLFRERDGIEGQVNLLGSTTFRLAEGQWHWLEVRQKLSSTDGQAVNEVRVDDQLIGSSTTRNYYGQPVSAIRYGIVAIDGGRQTLPLTLHYDRAVLGSGRLGVLS